MQFNFKQSVCLEGKDYTRGAHELSESVLELLSKNETFLLYSKLGLIEEKKNLSNFNSDSIQERNEKMVENALASKEPESDPKDLDEKAEEKPLQESVEKKSGRGKNKKKVA